MLRRKVNDKIIFSKEDWGEIVMFLIIIAVNKFGNYIENNPKYYSCPSYCEVIHKHINVKEINEYTRNDSGLFIQSKEQGRITESAK